MDIATEELKELAYILRGRLQYYKPELDRVYREYGERAAMPNTSTLFLERGLYVQTYKEPWKSKLRNVPYFAFLLTSDLNISNLLEESKLGVEEKMEVLCGSDGWLWPDAPYRVLCLRGIHLVSRHKQVLVVYPEEWWQKVRGEVERHDKCQLELPRSVVEQLMVVCPQCDARVALVKAYRRWMEGLQK